jgi:hypothetical protein
MCIKLVIKTNLYYDARSEKHQISTLVKKGSKSTVLRTSPYQSATRHPAHILNTALIYVQTDDTEHMVAKSQ